MLKKLSTYFVRTLREDPADAEVASHKLLVRACYIRRAAPGVYTWLPLGLRVLRKIENVVREEMDRAGAQEVEFPALLPREPYEATNRWNEFGPSLFKLKDRKEADYLLAPTHEEMFTLLVKDLYSSYKDLPVVLYQIQTKYRDEARPRAGLIRGREFVMKDAYSFDIDDAGLNASYESQRNAYKAIFDRLGLKYVICSAMAGAMGGSRSEEFLFPCAIGEDTFVQSPGGYAANVEAVKTPPLPALDYSAVAAPKVIETPGAKTIAELVDVLNAVSPRGDRPWSEGDLLKHVVVVVEHPDGESELLVIAVPGDREIDMKRVEAALAPAEVRMADAQDLKAFPEIVAGFIGPAKIGPNSPNRQVDADGNISGSVRYLIDPHVAEGSVWVTGADAVDKHIANMVYGRDFLADGTIEAATICEGDPAPDGSGALMLTRGIEIGHIFQLGRKYANSLGLTVLDEAGKSRIVTMGSYGIGVSRLLSALAEEYHDDFGLKWPAQVAPFDVHVIATGKEQSVFDVAERIATELETRGLDVMYDDRPRVSAGVKFKDAELIGNPICIVVGRGLEAGKVELRDRRSGEKWEFTPETIVAETVTLHDKLLKG